MKRSDPRHGTPAGYQMHRAEGNKACKRCLNAWAEWHRAYRARQKTGTG